MEFLPPNPVAVALVVISAAGLGVLAWLVWASGASDPRLSEVADRMPGEAEEEVAWLLVLQDRYPAFVAIMGAVASEFHLSQFLNRPDFASAFSQLRDGVYSGAPDPSMRAAMCHIVRCFLYDPEVEFKCREPLSRLVDQFLVEIEAADDAAA